MNYGFVIDNRKCIGCHACTTACKSENEVPLGVNRTWVKYTETGVFPETKRHFQVTRCNHCANPPCVAICPTGAMFQRKDGIVEFDKDICIGCKACMQACPYDAIYIDPETQTAAKCHYCAHRTEIGLEPACVVVCPEHAILSGDLDDPSTEIARAVRENKVTVRKPEQGTRPKLFYIDVEPASVVPMAAAQAPSGLWSEMPQGGDWRKPFAATEGALTPRPPLPGGEGEYRTANMAASIIGARETYNVPHRVPWHWPVPAYLVTKAISAGTFMVAGVGMSFGYMQSWPRAPGSWSSGIAVLFALITTVLLIADLTQPKRFYYMMVRPQWKSWLTKGAFVLIAFTAVAGLSWLGYLMGTEAFVSALRWPGIGLGVLAAIYTAFLFAQAEGRDLWQSKLLSVHLFVQAVMAGAAALLITETVVAPAATTMFLTGTSPWQSPITLQYLGLVLGVSGGANVMLALIEVHGGHGTPEAQAAARSMQGPSYWLALFLSTVACLGATLISIFQPTLTGELAWAGLLSLVGLTLYEWAFVMAPQEVPNN